MWLYLNVSFKSIDYEKVLLGSFVMSLWGHLLMAQEKAVSGIVVSTEDGLPMIGVAVVDKQTMNGVTTNEKESFR